jgi:hypothetical protein
MAEQSKQDCYVSYQSFFFVFFSALSASSNACVQLQGQGASQVRS